MSNQQIKNLRNIAEIPAYWSRLLPDQPALEDGGEFTTYRQLQASIDGARETLMQYDVGPGDRVMIVGENSLTLIAFLFATASLQAWPMPVNARMAPREIDVLLGLSEPRVSVYVTDSSRDAENHAMRSDAFSVTVPALAAPVFLCSHVVPRPSGSLTEPEAIGLLLATSGTTGTPKAVMVPHAGLLNFGEISVAERRLVPGDRVTALLPMSHIFGAATQLLATLYGGGCLRIERRFDAESLYAAIVSDQVTMMLGVPVMFRRLLEVAARSGRPHSQDLALRYAYVGAAALEPELKREFEAHFGCTLQHGWGMTEYAGSMFITRADRPREGPTAGFINRGCEARFVNKNGVDVGAGEVGEIWIRGPGLMRGYFRAPELTAQSMRLGGWFNTGDLGRLESDGALFLVGRSKDMLIRSGFNVYPAEVEAALNAHPHVMQSVVLGFRGPDGDEDVLAVIEPRFQADLLTADLERWLRERLSPYKIPSRWHIMAALPTLSNGKIARQALRELVESSHSINTD